MALGRREVRPQDLCFIYLFGIHRHPYVVEVSYVPRNPGPSPNRHRTKFSWAQHQAQNSYLSPAPIPAVYPLSITLLILRPA